MTLLQPNVCGGSICCLYRVNETVTVHIDCRTCYDVISGHAPVDRLSGGRSFREPVCPELARNATPT